jgi:hypothetical protein
VGNTGHHPGVSSEFSIPPVLHNRDLENLTADQPSQPQGVPLLFHFSGLNYGDYCLCIYLLPTVLNNPSRIRQPRSRALRRVLVVDSQAGSAKRRAIQRTSLIST